MDSTSQNDSDGGGGRHGRLPPPAGSPAMLHDEGRPQPRPTVYLDGPPDPGSANRQLAHTPAVLSLDQIRISRSSNEYTEGPTVVQRSPAAPHRQQKSDLVLSPNSRTGGQETPEEGPNNLRNLNSLTQYGNTNTSISREGAARSSSPEDSQSSFRTSVESTYSDQRLLASPTGSDQIIRTQPKRAEPSLEELKPLNHDSRTVLAVPGSRSHKNPDVHTHKCEDCGRCCCPECSRPRVLPSCWTCGRRCVCSVQNVVEYGTCVCCVKGLFYHCSSDDEDTCADKPFSCTQSHCCARWATVSLLSVVFPCLLCYLPAKGCVAACQCCYDRVTRPGCRCKNTSPVHREDAGKPT